MDGKVLSESFAKIAACGIEEGGRLFGERKKAESVEGTRGILEDCSGQRMTI